MIAVPKIYVAGHRGLVGSALARQLSTRDDIKLVTTGRAELDLTNREQTFEFFAREKPDVVFLAAAKVGGILANDRNPVGFLHENLTIQQNVMEGYACVGGRRLIFLGSNCIYPKICPQPIREDYLLTGQLEPTNSAYAVAKIAGIEACLAFNRQFNTQFLALMPINLYGPGDYYNLADCHVLPALLRKTHEAVIAGSDKLVVWGDGSPRREFMYSDDLADVAILLGTLADDELAPLLKANRYPMINIGSGSDITIRELAQTIAEVVGFAGHLEFDTSKPNGTPRKLLDTTLMGRINWRPKIEIRDGLTKTYADFLKGNFRC